jgi:hypothetical protein
MIGSDGVVGVLLHDGCAGDERAHLVGRCCVGRMLAGSAGVVLCLDAAREFGKSCWKPVLRVSIHAELVVASAEVWTKACPVLMTRAERSRLSPRIGCKRDFRRP